MARNMTGAILWTASKRAAMAAPIVIGSTVGVDMITQALAARTNAGIKKHKNQVRIAAHCILQHAKAEAHNMMHRAKMEAIRVTKALDVGMSRKYDKKTSHGKDKAQQAKINAILSTFDKNDGKAAEKIATALGVRLSR